ncbi:hypothetical protein Bca52824_019755 [Brassica carinata]|uniref:Uncharacterized protein n=1 Tax=Brassica carinata TaxID=52824 RepID=A0A8X7VT77_BRACI|nr:hypothetical protein Bca52824_019755 [Brassica carinata]
MDVVGQILSIKSHGLKNAEVKSPVVIRLLIAPTIEVYLSLWDQAAAMFREVLNSGDKTHSIFVVTAVNPKKELKRCTRRGLPCFNPKTEMKRKKLASIGNIQKYISNSNNKELDFNCKARIDEVLKQNGW